MNDTTTQPAPDPVAVADSAPAPAPVTMPPVTEPVNTDRLDALDTAMAEQSEINVEQAEAIDAIRDRLMQLEIAVSALQQNVTFPPEPVAPAPAPAADPVAEVDPAPAADPVGVVPMPGVIVTAGTKLRW